MTKIKNAIILAAGRGSRMKHLTDNMPKCMMQINNKTIIRRTIEILKYKNINNIIVVTGYKSDILTNYIRSFDKSITFINNSAWAITNSIYSMFLVSKYLHDTLVIDSDIYINNPDCILTEVEFSGYSAVKTYNSKEWNLHVNDEHIIDYVHTDYSNANVLTDNCLPIIDISYWLNKDSKFIDSTIKSLILTATSKDVYNQYWDEVPLRHLLHALSLKRYDINEDDAIEFDTEEELNDIRSKVCLVD